MATLESPDYAVISTLRGRCIAVEACHASRRKEGGDSLLDLLRTEAHRFDIHRITLRAGTRNGGCITAVVALHTVGRAVHRERHVTMRTTQSPATRTTLHEGRKTSTILEQHSLLATLQSLANGVQKHLIEVCAPFATLNRTHCIRDNYAGRGGCAVTLQKLRVTILLPLRIGVALQRGRSTAQHRMTTIQRSEDNGRIAALIAGCGVALLVA